MSVSDFSRSAGAVLGSRSSDRRITAMLAACMVCTIAIEADAASNSAGTFVAMSYFSAVSAAGDDNAPATSFSNRFEHAQTSLIRGLLASPAYQVPPTPLSTASLPRRQTIVPAAAAIAGMASMYNPTDPTDRDSGSEETASGERYDAKDWTAAIRTDLRAQFGGVRFGKNYRPAFALVQSSDKQAIVRINDVGPLKRGRIIDLNERAMRYFDPTMQLGLIDHVKVTPLAGQHWALGPVDDDPPVNVASRFEHERPR